MKPKVVGLLLMALVFCVSAMLSSPVVLSQAQDEYVGSKGCGMCHKAIKELFDKHAHAKLAHGCEDCHGPGHEHAATGPKNLRELKKNKGDLKIISHNKSEMCGMCHKRNKDNTLSLFSDDLVLSKQQYTEMLINKKAKFKFNCVMCHDPHATVKSKEGIKRACLDCHKAKFKKDVKIKAMAGLSCEDCHMPYAGRKASDTMVKGYHKGDERSHIFGISADPDYKLNDGSKKAALNKDGFARLTVEMTCYACHKTGTGGAPDMSREVLLDRADKIH
ncbi:hypothetical protein ACFL1R_10750 [Candidatus Latescibacterota bacterium]